MFTDILEAIGPFAVKALAGVACVAVFAPLLAAFVGFVGPVFGSLPTSL